MSDFHSFAHLHAAQKYCHYLTHINKISYIFIMIIIAGTMCAIFVYRNLFSSHLNNFPLFFYCLIQYQISSFTFLSFNGSKCHLFLIHFHFFSLYAYNRYGKNPFANIQATKCKNLSIATSHHIVIGFTKANHNIQ